MKFTLHEVKLWFKKENSIPKSYEFLPDKVNVITGDATTGKTSFLRIIDYCLLSNKMMIASTIIENVTWFGIRFTINNKEISIARKSPTKGSLEADVFFNIGSWPSSPIQNMKISELKLFLDKEFGINDNLTFPLGKELGKSPFNITYRYFLLFNSLTEDIIGVSETYFDTTFYGKEEYDKALKHIFDMVIGVNDMINLKAKEQIHLIENEIKKLQSQNSKNNKKEKEFQSGIFQLVTKLKESNLLDNSASVESIEVGLTAIDDVVSSTKIAADNTKVFAEIDELNNKKTKIKTQLYSIERYRKEYEIYKKNLSKSADSLKPVDFLNNNLSDQLIESYETKIFIDSLGISLKEIQKKLSKNITEPLKVSGDEKELQSQLQIIENRITQLNLVNKNFQTEGIKFMITGEIKNAKEQLIKNYIINPIDPIKLSKLNEEKINLEANIKDVDSTKFVMKTLLNKHIQRNYDQLNSLLSYKNSETLFDDTKMILQLKPVGQFFPLDNVGSKSNYMLMHLCFYLGLHEHIMNVSPEHVPQFLFIDQPSIPYYSGSNTQGNNDKSKLIDAFTLLNSFIEYIKIEKGNSFQIFMVEHAPKEYWTENKLKNFHTVAEFINGEGLIPKEYLKNNI